MREIDQLLGNYLAGNKVRRPYQNNQEARGKNKFRPKKENEKMNAVMGPVTRGKRKSEKKKMEVLVV